MIFGSWESASCMHPDLQPRGTTPNYHLGESIIDVNSAWYCSTMRGLEHACGKHAKYFAPRETPDRGFFYRLFVALTSHS